MLPLVFWSLLVLVIVGGIAFLVFRTQSRIKPQIPIRQAIEAARAALKNKQEWPKLYFCSPEKMQDELIAYNALKADSLNQPGVFRMRWPHLDLHYSVKAQSEEVRLHLDGQEKEVTLLYLNGELASMSLGDDRFRLEDFEMRHAVSLASSFRLYLRKQLCGGYGTHERKKIVDNSQHADYQVNASGEIKLSELPGKKG